MVIMGDDKKLMGVLFGWVPDTIRDDVRVSESVSDVLEGGAGFLDDFLDLVNLYFNWG